MTNNCNLQGVIIMTEQNKKALEEIIAQIDGAVTLSEGEPENTLEIVRAFGGVSDSDTFLINLSQTIQPSEKLKRLQYALLGTSIANTLESHGGAIAREYNNFHVKIRRAYGVYGLAEEIIESPDASIQNFTGINFARKILERFQDNKVISPSEATLFSPLPAEMGRDYIKRVVDYVEGLSSRVEKEKLDRTTNTGMLLYASLDNLLYLIRASRTESQHALFSDIQELSIRQGYSGVKDIYHEMKRLQDKRFEVELPATGIKIAKNALTTQRELSALLTPIYQGLVFRGHKELDLYG